ncbi:MAG: hypothetical protein DSM106950_12415 [Stigonema ocellatum SAG 48.90 = DSM 106950]|nr:hypothetical protein [Stigonema ocellatum SAG 48.90 = DSM 106950]
MSNIDLMTSANQDLFIDLNAENAETFNGGYEVFTIRNNTNANVGYDIDGTLKQQPSGTSVTWTAYNGGIITFDDDVRGNQQYKSYNLANGQTYEFRPNYNTTGNPYDIDLYKIS